MDRRTWLKTGAVGGVSSATSLGLDGCAHVSPAGPDASLLDGIDAADVERYLAGIDRRMSWIDKADGVPLVPPPTRPLTAEGMAEVETVSRLFRKSARALYLTGSFLEASTEVQAHPGMQARVVAAQSEMDQAVFGTTAMLESLTAEDHRKIRATLQERPQLAEELAQYLDAPAHQDGMPAKRRFVLRAGILELAGRMQAQPPGLVIDGYVKKVRKIEARGPRAAASDMSRMLAARIGEEAFWAHQERMAKLAAEWEVKLGKPATVSGLLGATGSTAPEPTTEPAAVVAPPTPGAVAMPETAKPTPRTPVPVKEELPQPRVAPRPAPPVPVVPTRGQSTLSTGGHIMGYGAGALGIGLVFAGLYQITASEAFLWPALIMGATVGPILLVVGLIVVIIGAIIRATET